MRILVTGGAGFIGSNFINYIIRKRSDLEIINLDKLTYAGNLANLKGVERDKKYRFFKGDICDLEMLENVQKRYPLDCIVNFAAETHVDRSIDSAAPFINTNIVGTFSLLDFARKHKIGRFVQISTDEVYGSLGDEGHFTETTPLDPSSPYSSSKASADLLALSYHKTFSLPLIITRCSNNYGPYQFPEKLIPLLITNALEDKMLPIYGDGKNVRDWIHVDDHSSAVELVMEKGKPGEVYNLGGDSEQRNIEIATAVCDMLEKPHSLIKFVADRPGHDKRYAMDFTKLRNELGWVPKYDFMRDGLRETVSWYKENTVWWKEVKSGEYRKYYEKMYKNRKILG